MEQRCAACGSSYMVNERHLAFYERVAPIFAGSRFEVPVPACCPDCRQQRRLAFRNERSLYHRSCAMSGRKIVSCYSPDKPFPVYDNELWWSDKWSANDYGRDFDFSRPFFEQYAELCAQVPKAALIASSNENSDFVNYALNCKNCYLILGWGENSEHCLYGKLVISCRDCLDISHAVNCELCYDCVDIENCYRLLFSQSCKQCSEAYYLKNCIGCAECFGCINLANRRYCIFNEQYSKSDYARQLSTLRAQMSEPTARAALEEKLAAAFRAAPHKYYQGINTHDCTGDYLRNCRRAYNCFDTSDTEDGAYLFDCIETRDCMDLTVAGKNNTDCSLECVNYTGQHCMFSSLVWLSHDLYYCQECFHGCHDCFGCLGLVHAGYCILNKPYARNDYEKLCARIVRHMQSTGEWGR